MTTDELLLALCKYDAIIVRVTESGLSVEHMRGSTTFQAGSFRKCLEQLARDRITSLKGAIGTYRGYIAEYDKNIADIEAGIEKLERATTYSQGDGT